MTLSDLSRHLSLLLVVVAVGLTGCKPQKTVPDYARELPPGMNALRKISPDQWPNLAGLTSDNGLMDSLNRSVDWYKKPSVKQFFPVAGITHEYAWVSTFAFREMLKSTNNSLPGAIDSIRLQFDLYESIGWDGEGTVLFTGYFTPVFEASAVRTEQFKYPLYKRPSDLVTDPATGQVLGRRAGSIVVKYPRRSVLESSGALKGQELVWMKDKLDCYIVQVNGSARFRMTDGTTRYIGYAGNNGYDYTSIGKLLVQDGKLEKSKVTLSAIRDYFRSRPDELDGYISKNDRFVFFTDYKGGNWPAGSLGFKVTPVRSLATDKLIFPRGCVVLVQTQTTESGRGGAISQVMLDQDTGGAIRAAGRADIYMGIGDEAERMAGDMVAEGRLYYFLLKPEYVGTWTDKLRAATPAAPVATAPAAGASVNVEMNK